MELQIIILKEILLGEHCTIKPPFWSGSEDDDHPYLARSLAPGARFVREASEISGHIERLARIIYFGDNQFCFFGQCWSDYTTLFKRDLTERKLIRRVTILHEATLSEFIV